MNSRERLLAAMSREVPDRVPRDISWGMTQDIVERCIKETGTSDYQTYFKQDHRFLYYQLTDKKINRFSYFEGRGLDLNEMTFDEWGVGYVKGKDKTSHLVHFTSPLINATSINEILDYEMPDFTEDYRWKHFAKYTEDMHKNGMAVAGPMACTIFETAWQIRGIDEFMIDMIEDQEMVECLLDRILEIRLKMTDHMVSAGIDVLMLGDDIAMQTGMMISPELWRKYFKPRMAKIIERARANNPKIHIFYHTDGNPTLVYDELIDIGINVLNPIQPECVDPAEVKLKYGHKAAFWGTIGVQSTLPFGTVEDVRNEVKLRMETVGKNGGLIIGPTHVLEPEVPWENIIALYDAIDEFGVYK